MAASGCGTAKGHSGPRLQARGQQRPKLCILCSSGPAWSPVGFPPCPSSLLLGHRYWAASKLSLGINTHLAAQRAVSHHYCPGPSEISLGGDSITVLWQSIFFPPPFFLCTPVFLPHSTPACLREGCGVCF